MKRILIIASRPLANDGLTKIEMDVIKYNKEIIQFYKNRLIAYGVMKNIKNNCKTSSKFIKTNRKAN